MPSRWIVFWRFQGIGWAVYLVATFPLKLMVFGDPTLALLNTLLRDGTGFLLTLGLRQIYRRWNRRAIATPWLIVAVLTISMGAETLETLVALAFQQRFPFLPEFSQSPVFLLGVFSFRAMLFAFWSMLYLLIKDWKEAEERERRLVQAENRRKEAELQMLRAQVNPHFLFNALNTIQSGLNHDQEPLKKVVLGLADYLRYSLANRDQDMVPLGEEFDAMLQYLKVEKGRFREELAVEAKIDEAARQLPVPGVILQPLVENAVRYGMEGTVRPLSIQIFARSPEKGRIEIGVSNSGNWIEPRGRRADGTGGTGLETLRRRLALLYPGRHDLQIKSEPGRVTVSIRIQPENSTDAPR